MKFFSLTVCQLILICSTTIIFAQADSVKNAIAVEPTPEKEALEIGGYVTLDYSADLSEPGNPTLEIGSVELGANVNVTEDVTATVLIAAESNLSDLRIDQAVASFAPKGKSFSLLFGQFIFNHGLLSTHLISDPLITDLISLTNPGLSLTYAHNSLSLGAGLTVLHTDEDLVTGIRSINNYAGIINGDIALPNESTMRISSLISEDMADVDIASGILLGTITVDIEGYTKFGIRDDADENASGYYIGVAWSPNDLVSLAVRNDGLSEDDLFGALDVSVGAGVTFHIKDGIFCAFEYSFYQPDEGETNQTIALQLGLESTLKIPGFQRRTLTRN